jgi:CheY-like chemotaxis protein
MTLLHQTSGGARRPTRLKSTHPKEHKNKLGFYNIKVAQKYLPAMIGLAYLCQCGTRFSSPCRPKPAPAIMLTAIDGVPNRIAGLDAGAEDYPGKLFFKDELLAHLRVPNRH